MAGMCLADGRLCVMGKCLADGRPCVFFDSAAFFCEVDWHQLIFADAELLLVMGMDDNVIESTITNTLLVLC